MPDNFNDTGFLLRNLMKNIPDLIYFKDRQSRYIRVNQSFCDQVGRSEEQISLKMADDFFPKQHADEVYADEQNIILTGKSRIGIEEHIKWPDGHSFWVASSKMPLKNAEGEIIGIFGISRDITRHKKAEFQEKRYAEEVRRIKDGLEDDVRMAAELQKTFFPRDYPVFPMGSIAEQSRVTFHHHYRPCSAVSGDFCAIHRLSETECGILQCDVMGHGVRAALVTALICAIVEELAQQERDPGVFLERMNELLFPILRQDDTFLFATACYSVYDTATGRIRTANAGHPIPVVIRRAEKTAEWLIKDASLRGPALAISEEATFQTVEEKLNPGDSVVLYTDGLYEVINSSDEELGEKRLLDTMQQYVDLPLVELFPALINTVSVFSEEGEFDDDICLIGFNCVSLGEVAE